MLHALFSCLGSKLHMKSICEDPVSIVLEIK